MSKVCFHTSKTGEGVITFTLSPEGLEKFPEARRLKENDQEGFLALLKHVVEHMEGKVRSFRTLSPTDDGGCARGTCEYGGGIDRG